MRSAIYNLLILRLTSQWYAEVMRRLSDGAALLDVGIGTAGALLANADTAREKGLVITGIDIDADYIKHARQALRESPLADRAEARLESIYDHTGGPYDAIYFSASFMLLPDPEGALRHCRSLLKPEGRVFFTQTFQTRPSRWMERFKPLLKRITTIDFGRVTYEETFREQVAGAGFAIDEFTTLGRHGPRASVLAIARPA
ncbi:MULTISPECIES: bifunctional 2-polyprenyl-6-hydroxyphenol methylase/3-demethylubiquinol 3-O-methyltransferase UbiG [unclassified Thioalkalivibrio]|uniref:class I SAM-dependent methyltransferase n=1 Tax=unclassified Thioalkalivibrio TaxID=2621013 RepID=UPI00037D4C1F|nr:MULTISPECIES: class I SAM-dependent methyltransferase [unclassified Thioalkalivibrio]